MMPENLVLPPQTEETLKLMEMHRQLTVLNGFVYAQEHDTYSLAQPSPFRYVPTIASNQTVPLPAGE